MTVELLAQALDLEQLVDGAGMDREVAGGYTGDLLSWVMGRARPGDALITVMGNVNAIAVCVLAEIPCIILAEDAALDENAREKAAEQGIPILRSDKNAYQLSVLVHNALENEQWNVN